MPAAFPQGTQTSPEVPRSPEGESSSGDQCSPGGPPVPLPAARREREGRRHGRAAFPESAADSAIRSRLVRLAAVPCLLVAVVATAVAAFAVQAGGAHLTGREWPVLAGGLGLVCVIVLTAGATANSEARAVVMRYARLREVCARSQSDLYDLLDRVRRGDRLHHRDPASDQTPAGTGDTLDLLAHEVTSAGRAAEAAVIDAVAIARSNATGSEQKVEVFVNLARRLQSLVHREILLLDELEHQVEDPDLLKGIFHVDHLATRTRRHAENLAVLGGAISRRQWTRPISMVEVLRSSIAEVEQYPRVKLVPPIEGHLQGHAVADVVHLLAELVENASIYSAPQTPIMLRAQLVTAGLAVEVEDRGLGMDHDEQTQMNALLADPYNVDVAELLSDGRIGLYVVASLARRHGIVVQLRNNIYGGVQAVLIVPTELLGEAPPEEDGKGDRATVTGAAPTTTATLERDDDHEHDPYARYASDAYENEPRGRHRSLDSAATGPERALEAPRRGADDHSAMPPTGPVRATAPAHPDSVSAPGPTHAGAAPGPVQLPPAPPVDPDDGARPRLPRRIKQTHLVPELRGEPILPSQSTGPEPEHDPTLMATFQRGFSLGDDDYAAGLAPYRNRTPAGQGGETSSPGGPQPLADHDHEAPTARPRGDDHNHGE
ncbi:sensor histidine kinase [Streptomyces natalensis]|uniref:sensor histidine kinase n=1 Tax=Streptomyces natalensis TaxID=68242 RepID=UPI00069A5C61|nr:ATP-binding protein [Streptomyces natalensis]